MRKLIQAAVALTLAFVLCLQILPLAAMASEAYGEEDFLYTINNGGVTISGYLGDDTSVIIPSQIENMPVTTIGARAFYQSDLTRITLPNSVTTIGSLAFSGSVSLASINIPSGVTTIGVWAFFACRSLTSINIPNGITAIGDNTFTYCSALTSINIPSGVTTIGNYAFSSCYDLTSITIPNTVTTIGDGAFSSCSKLTNITIPSSVTTIGDSLLESTAVPNPVIAINGSFLVYVPKNYIYYTIPSSVTKIGGSAFYECNIKSITIPDSVTAINNQAFQWCYSLTNVTIPNSVTTIGDYAFNYCDNLTIYGENGSYAQSYAEGWGIPFTVIVGTRTVTFDSRGGSAVENRTVSTGDTISSPTDPVKDGDTFIGWYTAAVEGTKITFPYTVTANVTLYARWLSDPVKPGDIDGDGKVGFQDLTVLSRYIAGWSNLTYVEGALDPSGDGTTDSKDITVLSRYLAGWNVTLQ